MRISDWSSDVCSSDLARRSRPKGEAHGCAECIPRPDIDARDTGRIPRSLRAVSCERTSLWWPRRPLATLDRKLRQGRKAATVSIDAGAEVSRRGHRLFPLRASARTAGYSLHWPVATGQPILDRLDLPGAIEIGRAHV